MDNTFKIPSDINQNKNIVAPLEKSKALNIGIYIGDGSTEEGVSATKNNIRNTLNIEVQELTSEDIHNKDLSLFDVIIFSGGSGSKQAETIGETGRENIRKYLENGGGYLGICAGAYLATSGFDWSLHILNAETISTTEWKRGKGFVDLEFTNEGKEIFGDIVGTFKCRYSSGPLLKPSNKENLPLFKSLGYFRSEISENGVTEGVMIDTPSIVSALYGKGKVLLTSPHPEDTPGLENLIPKALYWLTN